MREYDHKKIEQKWTAAWKKADLYRTADSGKEKKYILDMFPYPSGAGLHVGHVEGYTATDIYSRYLRMKGFDVLHPMGWDAFGLPAENYAIKTKVHPKITTEEAIQNFTKQINSLGLSYDWSREIGTHTPEYYKWTQWFFLLLYKHRLAYRAKAKVNWCPKDQTVLANEQVVEGKCERCGTEVVQKDLEQWFFRITNYADDLIAGLDTIDWPDSTKAAQRNWIGRSEGAEIDFPLPDSITRIVLLHGRGGTSDGAWKPWLKAILEKRGYEVQVPQMPGGNDPDDEVQADYVQKNCTLDEHTAVVGHSFGGIVALRLLERGVKLGRVTLVATPYTGKYLDGKPRSTVTKALEKEFDYEKIKANCGGFVAAYDTTDTVVPLSDGEAFAEKLGCYLLKGTGAEPHFNGTEEHDVLLAAAPALRVFTTRADTLFGATYLVLAPEHPWVKLAVDEKQTMLKNKRDVLAYLESTQKKTELERLAGDKKKTGVRLEGIDAVNPATGKAIPLYVADYVLGHYGTGAVMGVPAHDERDFEFAKKYELPILPVIVPPGEDDISTYVSSYREREVPYTDGGALFNSASFDGMDWVEAKKAITMSVGGRLKRTYKLRDWLISRQRYWGSPIPIIYCEKCGEQPVPEKDLPVTLPDDVDFMPTGESPLTRSKSFQDVSCPSCGAPARRESDTMDTFVCSSWYFFRFADPRNAQEFASKEAMNRWLPVDMYVGGAEHTVLHLLYARFFTKVLQELGYVDFNEPFLALRHQGTILAEDGKKMSKSLGNVINPDDVVQAYGADSIRLYEMFLGPFDVMKPWNTSSIVGVRRFLERVYRALEYVQDADVAEIDTSLHKTIKKVSEDVPIQKFNTAISQLMIFINDLEGVKRIGKQQWGMFVRVLAPFAPYMAEELWSEAGNAGSVHASEWPASDAERAMEATITIAVQVHGKARAEVQVARTAEKDAVIGAARAAVGARIEGKEIVRTVYVPGRLVNFVLKAD